MDELFQALLKPRNLTDLEKVIKRGKELVKYIDKYTVRHTDDPNNYVLAYLIKMQQNAEAAKSLLEIGYGASALQFVRLFIEDYFNISYLLNSKMSPKELLQQFHDHKTLAKPIQYLRSLEEVGESVSANDKQDAEDKLSEFKRKYKNSEGRKGWSLLNVAEMSRELSAFHSDDKYNKMYNLMYSLFSEDTHGLSAPFFESTKDLLFGIENAIYNHNYRSEETVLNIVWIYNELIDLIINFYKINI